MKIQESAEMYLETILVLSQTIDNVHAIDIAKKMGFSKPSVSVTIHSLEKEDYLKIADNGEITLMPKGENIAKTIYERHNILGNYFMSIGVSKDVAFADACKIEHDISEESFQCIKNQLIKK